MRRAWAGGAGRGRLLSGTGDEGGGRRPGPLERLWKWRDETRQTVAVIRAGLRGLHRSQLPRMAAALAYRTIFSIIPIFVIGLVVFGTFVSEDQVEDGVHRMLEFAGLRQIAVESPNGPGLAPEGAEAEAPEDAEAAEEEERLDELIADLVVRVNRTIRNVPRTTIGLISVVILIYAAMSMLIEVERSFNQLYRAPTGRAWSRRLLLYWTMLTLGTLLLVTTFYVGERFGEWVLGTVVTDTSPTFLLGVTGFAITVMISGLLLLIGYTTIPNARVHVRPALVGALLAAVLWELGKWGFTRYLGFSAGYARFYGSLALLPLFLIWVYVTWMIVLFGLQVTYALQHVSEWEAHAARDGEDDEAGLADPARVLLVASGVADAFERGRPTGADALGERLGMPTRLVQLMLERLEEAGIVHRVVRGERDEASYTLARPPGSIDAAEVLRVGQGMDLPDTGDTGSGLIRRLNAARAGMLEGRTLQDVRSGTLDADAADGPGRAGASSGDS